MGMNVQNNYRYVCNVCLLTDLLHKSVVRNVSEIFTGG